MSIRTGGAPGPTPERFAELQQQSQQPPPANDAAKQLEQLVYAAAERSGRPPEAILAALKSGEVTPDQLVAYLQSDDYETAPKPEAKKTPFYPISLGPELDNKAVLALTSVMSDPRFIEAIQSPNPRDQRWAKDYAASMAYQAMGGDAASFKYPKLVVRAFRQVVHRAVETAQREGIDIYAGLDKAFSTRGHFTARTEAVRPPTGGETPAGGGVDLGADGNRKAIDALAALISGEPLPGMPFDDPQLQAIAEQATGLAAALASGDAETIEKALQAAPAVISASLATSGVNITDLDGLVTALDGILRTASQAIQDGATPMNTLATILAESGNFPIAGTEPGDSPDGPDAPADGLDLGAQGNRTALELMASLFQGKAIPGGNLQVEPLKSYYQTAKGLKKALESGDADAIAKALTAAPLVLTAALASSGIDVTGDPAAVTRAFDQVMRATAAAMGEGASFEDAFTAAVEGTGNFALDGPIGVDLGNQGNKVMIDNITDLLSGKPVRGADIEVAPFEDYYEIAKGLRTAITNGDEAAIQEALEVAPMVLTAALGKAGIGMKDPQAVMAAISQLLQATVTSLQAGNDLETAIDAAKESTGHFLIEAADEPVDVEEPGDTDEPGDVDKPGDTDDSGAVDEPGDTEDPGDVDEPGDTDEPGDVDEPGDTDEPGDVDEPEDPEGTGDVDEPENTDGPSGHVEPENDPDVERPGGGRPGTRPVEPGPEPVPTGSTDGEEEEEDENAVRLGRERADRRRG